MSKRIEAIAAKNSNLAKKLRQSKVLHLPLYKGWFNMIAKGEKDVEYRAITPYWLNRLYWLDREHSEEELYEVAEQAQKFGQDGLSCFEAKIKHFDYIIFSNGYKANAPILVCECGGISIDFGKEKLGAAKDVRYFCISVSPIHQQ